MEQTKLEKVINILNEKGYTEGQIAYFVQNLTKTNFARAYVEAMATFTKEDIAKIENTTSQEQADKIIAEIYTQRTGKNANIEAQKFIEVFCEGFLKAYEKTIT